MPECSICCEKFNKSNRSPIKCKTCADDNEVVACQSCAKRYILEQPTDASCMVCKVEWDIDFLYDNFTKTFINKELKVHRENYLLEKQIALLPDTQHYAEQLKMIDGYNKQKQILYIQKRKLEESLRVINTTIAQLDDEIYDIRNNNNMERDKQEEKGEFKFKCPVEDCNGFLNDKFYCGICENKICRHCMEVKLEDHECDPDKKDTVALLKKDTKPCPKCGQLIHKTNGCDQMYCIKCHTAFSWKTGAVERGAVHNPEYYRWMRENGQVIPRNPLDIQQDPCNQLIPYQRLLTIMRTYYPVEYTGRNEGLTLDDRIPLPGIAHRNIRVLDNENTVKILHMHRLILHIQYELNNDNNNERDMNISLRYMRAQYILSKLTKDDFKKKLQMINKRLDKGKRINNVWNLLRIVLNEYIGKIQEIAEQDSSIETGQNVINNIIIESEKIRKYCNQSFKKIGKMFNMTYPGIKNDWVNVTNWEMHKKNLANANRANVVIEIDEEE